VQRVCVRDSGPSGLEDRRADAARAKGDVSDQECRTEPPKVVGPSLRRHGQSQHSGNTVSTRLEGQDQSDSAGDPK